MSDLDYFYLKWRWLTYHDIDIHHIESIIENPELWENSIYSSHITNDLVNDYLNENYHVSDETIKEFDIKMNKQYLEKVKNCSIKINSKLNRSVFIENCNINLSQYSRKEITQIVKQNLIYYHWWDVLNYEEFIKRLFKIYFLKSTLKLINERKPYEYFENKYCSKQNLVKNIFYNFKPCISTLNRMNGKNFFPTGKPLLNTYHSVIYDYTWLFNNDLLRSIRIIENEFRLANNEKIIGAYYNENVLFREIHRTFSSKFRVLSQGSPKWLLPQRFDIYFPELNIAIEYQGEQHFNPVDFGGKGKAYAKKQYKVNLKRDNIKRNKAMANDCALFYVIPGYDIKNIINNIKKEIRKRTNINT